MNLILLFPDDFVTDDRVRLCGRRLEHVLRVHRARVGDDLRVGREGGRLGRGRVIGLDTEALELEVSFEVEPPPPLPLLLLLALPRPPVLRRVLIAATALGVKRIALFNANRVEKSFWSSRSVREESIREQLVLGLEQARDSVLPEVWLRPRFRPFVEDELPDWIRGSRALLAHPEAAEICPRALSGPVTLAIGPEGGWVPFEIERLLAIGFESVSLGPRILRVETAFPALLSRLF